MFDSLSSKFASAFSSLRSRGRIKSSDIDEIVAEIRSALIESDVAQEVATTFSERVKGLALPELDRVNKSTNP